MPPALETIDLDSDQELPDEPRVKGLAKPVRQALIPVINRSGIRPGRQYPDGPLPIRPSTDAPKKARITGRTVDENGVEYTLMVGDIQVPGVGVEEVLSFVSAYDLEEYENGQFVEEEEARMIAEAAEEAEREEERLKKKERSRRRGVVLSEDLDDDPVSDDNDGQEVLTGRHGRARPTYKHLYKKPGGLTGRRRRKRDPRTGELMPLSDEEDVEMAASSDDQANSRSGARSVSVKSSTFPAGLELPKRRRRKRHPITNELMPLSDRDNSGGSDGEIVVKQSVRSSSVRTMDPPTRSSPVRTVNSGSVRRSPPQYELELGVQKRRRRKRDPVTGELLPLDPVPQRSFGPLPIISSPVRSSSARQEEERQKRPRRRRHPITNELMPLGWVYDPNAEPKPYQATGDVPLMQRLSISRDHESKRRKLTSEPSSSEEQQQIPLSKFAASPHTHTSPRGQVVNLGSSDSEDQDDPSSMQLSAAAPAPPKSTTQVRSPKHGMMMQRAPSSSSSSGEPITLASFLSTTATGKVNEDESSEDSSSPPAAKKTTTPQKTSIMNPVTTQQEDSDDDGEGADSQLDEGEFFVQAILAHHMSDPRTHPGKPSVMLFKTKWEGFEEVTWEPAASFADPSILEEYCRKAGVDIRVAKREQ